MEVPLLLTKQSTTTLQEAGTTDDYLEVKSLSDAKFVVWSESVKIWKVALPVAVSSLFQFLMFTSTSIYAGHLGDIQLSSLSLYTGAIGSISLNLLYGMSSALFTLCGQAYGAGQIQSTGIYLQWSWIVLFLTSIILLPLHIYATPILKFLGQDKQISHLAGNYSMQMIPSMFSYAINFPTQKFLQAQSKVNVIMGISFVSLLIQNGLLYVFIYVLDWGIDGLTMAHNIACWALSLGLATYAVCWAKEEWIGLSWWAFRDLWAFARLSLSLSGMSCLEQWSANFIVILAGQLDNAVIAVGSYSICTNIQGWYYMLLIGISTGVSVRVSHTLGMSHPRAAKYSFFVTISQSLFLGVIIMTVIFLSKENLAIIFTSSEDMIKGFADLVYILGISMVLSSASQVISGVAIGSGWQVMVGCINLACYYIIGLSLGIFFGFKQHLGVKGLWGGTMCGSIVQILVLIVIIWKTNWTKEVEQTANRLRIWNSNNPQKKDII